MEKISCFTVVCFSLVGHVYMFIVKLYSAFSFLFIHLSFTLQLFVSHTHFFIPFAFFSRFYLSISLSRRQPRFATVNSHEHFVVFKKFSNHVRLLTLIII